MQTSTQTLPIGLNTLFGFHHIMQVTILRRYYGRTVTEMNIGIQSATELYNLLKSEGYVFSRSHAEWDFAKHAAKTYVVELL